MNRHPGGQKNTEYMIKIAGIPQGARILDMGAGAGETVRWLRKQGYSAKGIDLEPQDPVVEKGDFLNSGLEKESFDAIISQCAFFISGNTERALQEAYRLLKPGGFLMLSDLFSQKASLLLEGAGFETVYEEDLTAMWKEYYIEALWREDVVCSFPHIKCTYRLMIGRRKEDGSV